MFNGKFLIANCKYNYIFAADDFIKDGDHVVEARQSDCAGLITKDLKFLWEISDAGNGYYYIKNAKHGYMFAAKGDKQGNDHMVECKPNASGKDLLLNKFKWLITKTGRFYAVENREYGAAFADDTDLSGEDHIVEASPNALTADKYQSKFKWIFFDTFTLSNWMGQLDDSKSLAALSIPGTHDSCTYNYSRYPTSNGGLVPGGVGAAVASSGGALVAIINSNIVTQTSDLTGQLNAGVRFLDIRCRHSESHFSIFHNMVFLGLNFQDVLDKCYAFLDKNQSETIIMSVRDEGGGENPTDSFQKQFETYINPKRSSWFLENRIPNLKEVRGKIILLRRFAPDTSPVGLDWNSSQLTIQDEYQAPSKEKWSKVKDSLNKARTSDFDKLFINFTSASLSFSHPLNSPITVADYVNPRLVDHIASKSGRLGIIPMDFNLANISAVIISTNFTQWSNLRKTEIVGGKGTPFDDIPTKVENINPVIKLVIRSGDIVDDLTVYYEDSEVSHGGDGGGKTTICIDPGDYITEVSGDYGSWYYATQILSLSFKTKNGKSFGPYGSEAFEQSKTPFSFKANSGEAVIGFCGSINKHSDDKERLSAIGVGFATYQ
ncbi:MAG: phosphatidylinositol-specific phospholipase C domain-containing protein [Pyrinomonadaceae bacterium]|nr:phosphatidylinositol-specific phospholipase C domain-containing protein [Pyrinomonadaceae bacterium]